MTDRPVALVTGAAGGVGRALLAGLTAAGYAVVAEDISPEVNSLEADDVAVVVGDSADSGVASTAIELASTRFGRLDLVVNNAAVFLNKSVEETTDENWDLLMRVNVRGPFVHARGAVAALAASGGSIVNVASISGLVGMPGQIAYTSSKGALLQMTRTLAVELGPRGIRVNAVAPGTIDTPFVANSLERGDAPAPEDFARTYPLGRILQPQEIADAVLFLASPQASSITGTILTVDGGYTAR
jgi:NAD(P)-dependent dehydrogenase (short-subunit alcohol dehydrogenase family)